MIRIGPHLSIPERELHWSFSRSSGPGGQNVNKLATRATLRFDVANNPSLSDSQRATLLARLRSRITATGELQLSCDVHRTQPANKAEALERFIALLREALRPRRARKKTKPTRSSIERRHESKRQRSETKRRRRPPRGAEE